MTLFSPGNIDHHCVMAENKFFAGNPSAAHHNSPRKLCTSIMGWRTTLSFSSWRMICFFAIFLLLGNFCQLGMPHQIVLDLSDSRLIKCLNAPCDPNTSTIRKQTTIKVCGSDGRTYGSMCELKKASCLGHNITVQSTGECSATTIQKQQLSSSARCTSERIHAQKQAQTPKVGVFIPRCHVNGSFTQVQCYAAFDYCWCVDAFGRPIPGTSSHSKRPNCSGISPLFLPGDGVQKRSAAGPWSSRRKVRQMCTADNRKTFNANLLLVFAVEYIRSQPNQTTLEQILLPPAATNTTVSGQAAKANTNIQFAIQAAKFAQLDVDNTGNLSRAELRTFRQLIKRVVMPRRCSRSFIGYCDLDQDRFVTLTEWQFCLHVAEPQAIRAALEHYYESNHQNVALSGGGDGNRRVQPKSIGLPEFGTQQKPVAISPEQRRLIDVTNRRAQQQRQQLIAQRAAAAAAAKVTPASAQPQPRSALGNVGRVAPPWAATQALSLLQPAGSKEQQLKQKNAAVVARQNTDDDYDDIGHQGDNDPDRNPAMRNDFNSFITANTARPTVNDQYDGLSTKVETVGPAVSDGGRNLLFATVEQPSITRHKPLITATVHEANDDNDSNADDDDENIWEAHLKYGRRRSAAANPIAINLQQRFQQQQRTALLPTALNGARQLSPLDESSVGGFGSRQLAMDSSQRQLEQGEERRRERNQSNKNSGEPRSCTVERQKAQLRQRTHSVAAHTVHVPECDGATGKFRPAQCHPQADFCWCVNIHTGVPVPGSSVPATTTIDDTSSWGNGQAVINCTNVRPVRHFEGCPPELQAEFVADLLEIIQRQHVDTNNYENVLQRSENTTSKSAHNSTAWYALDQNEREVRWKFSQLDVDRSRKLERREWLALRVELRRRDRLRKCSRNFLRFCDANDDRIIDMDEWLKCCLVSNTSRLT